MIDLEADDQADDQAEQQAEHARRAASFGAAAAAYDEHRPDYPVAALRWGLEPVRDAPDLRVLDLAAGTGKLTAGLLALDLDVVAVEPDPAMLAALTGGLPSVAAKPGTAEDIPLPDNSVNAVFVGQALHWFDLARAGVEMARVLRPGGVVVALWNTEDDSVPWVAGFREVSKVINRPTPTTENMAANLPELPGFTPMELGTFPHRHTRTAEGLVRTVATTSHLLIMAEDARERRLAEIRTYLAAQPETQDGEFDLPMRTLALRALRR